MTSPDDVFAPTASMVLLPADTAVPELAAAVERAGYVAHVLPRKRSDTKGELLTTLATALQFPSWFGHNWDALADCLGDLTGRHCVIWRGAARLAEHDPQGFETFCEIVAEIDSGRLVVVAIGAPNGHR
jgi:hypothetical protein